MPQKTSRKWSNETKNLVNNSKLNLLRVYDNSYIDDESLDILKSHNLGETCHCDFCGQRIKYVSVLEFDKSTVISHFQIGKECMSYLFDYGMKIEGLDSAKYQVENAVKKLIKKSTERARAEKYKKELATYITWLDNLDKNFIERNSFLRFINERLRTGNGVINMNMINALEGMIKKYTPISTQNLPTKSAELLAKIDKLLNDIEIVYSNKQNGTYLFVSSVKNFVAKNGNASQKQLNAMNEVFLRIKKMRKEQAERLLKKSFQPEPEKSTEYIPF